MSDELRFVNAFIGFCTPMGGTWPDPLVPLAYQVVGIEQEILTSLSGVVRKVVPELICASEYQNHVICLEAKSATLSLEQAQKYLAITSQELHLTGVLPSKILVTALSHDTLYVTHPTNAAVLVNAMNDGHVSLPVITGDDKRFALCSGTIGNPAIQQAFTVGIDIAQHHEWPTHFVQFNKHAPVDQLAAPVLRSLSQFLLRSENFTTQSIAEHAVPHWKYCGTDERNAFLNKIHGILNNAQREELKPYFKPVRPPKRVKPERNRPWQPLGKRPMSTNAIMALQRLSTKFVYRQQTGTPFKKHQPPLPGL